MFPIADLSRKENTAPDVASTAEIQRSFQRSILNGKQRDEQKIQLPGSRRKRLSVTEVSDMLFEFYKTKSAKVPKAEQPHRQVSPTSGEILDPRPFRRLPFMVRPPRRPQKT